MFSAETLTDSSLFGEIQSAYSSGAYPGTMEFSVQMEKNFPLSLLIPRTLLLKGKSFYHLARYSEAAETLEKAGELAGDDSETAAESLYWKGRSEFALADYSKAASSFYEVCFRYSEKNLPDSVRTFYNMSVLYAGKSFYRLNEFAKAVPLFEKVISGGNEYGFSEYGDTCVMLFDCYSKTENYTRAIEVYENFSKTENRSEIESKISLCAGDSYAMLGMYKKAYDCYAAVLLGEDSALAAEALQKAYGIASSHKKEVGRDPGAVLESARDTLFEYDSLLAEFWTRLGTDAFADGDFKKAASYFDNAESDGAAGDVLAVVGLYRSRMKGADKRAVLESYFSKSQIGKESVYYADYETSLAECTAYEKEWTQSLLHAKNALSSMAAPAYKNNLYESASYWFAFSSLMLGDSKGALAALEREESRKSPESVLLYARLLYSAGKKNESLEQFKKLDAMNFLDKDSSADYAKVLFSCGYMKAALRQSLFSNTPDGWYMTALSSFNLADWRTSEKYFSKYIESGAKENVPYALFYCGYSRYKLGENLSAYKMLSEFTGRYSDHPLAWNANMVAANVAAANSNYDEAARHAENALNLSNSDEEKQNAYVLCASVYSDARRYDDAIRVLSEPAKKNDDFGIRSRYQIAQLYATSGNLSESDALFAKIQNDSSAGNFADEASYRRGELYYSAKEYASAISRFSEYQKKFPRGKFLDAAVYYIADSYAQQGRYEMAELQYRTLISEMPESSFIYSSRKNLMNIYRTTQNYKAALEQSDILLGNFSEESAKDGIYNERKELSLLASGIKEDALRLENEYKSAGGSSTREGRINGTALAEYLWSQDNRKDDAAVLAEELYSIQSSKKNEASEFEWAAKTGMIVAAHRRSQNDSESAANVYLSVSRYARMSGNDEDAGRALYGAAEAFSAAGKEADASLTAENLLKLYPDGPYAQSVRVFLK